MFSNQPHESQLYTSSQRGKEVYRVQEREFDETPSETPRDSLDLEKSKSHEEEPDHHGPPEGPKPKLPFGKRLKHFTWAWYTLIMSTGGVATLLSIQPHAFPGLISIGAVFYILNLVLFTGVTTTMAARFAKYPGTLKESLKHEREGLFFPTFWLSIATIIIGTQKYVVQASEDMNGARGWLTTSIAIAFWAYTICTFLLAIFQYSYLFAGHTYKLEKMMPSWLLPIFPIMLAGTIASVIAADQPIEARVPIVVAGLACQGLGFAVSILMYAHLIGRLMHSGLPNREHRPALFIGVGPPSFTALALLGMANSLPPDFDITGDDTLDGATIRTLATVSALFLYALAIWFFFIAAIASLLSRPKYFHLGWWTLVFPNTGFTIATISIGNALKSEGILFVGNGLTVCIVCTWAFVLFYHIRAVIKSDIMYPGWDEDVED